MFTWQKKVRSIFSTEWQMVGLGGGEVSLSCKMTYRYRDVFSSIRTISLFPVYLQTGKPLVGAVLQSASMDSSGLYSPPAESGFQL